MSSSRGIAGAPHLDVAAATTGQSDTQHRDIDLAIEPVLIDVPTACRLLGGISRHKLDQLILDGHITPKSIGTRVVFTPAELRRFADACPDWAPRN